MKLSKDGKMLYIVNTNYSNSRKGSITIIDREELKVVDRIEVGKTPTDIAYGNNEEYLFVSDIELNMVHVVDFKTKKVVEKLNTGKMPLCVQVDNLNKYLLTTNIQDNTLTIINLDKLNLVKNIKVGSEPTSILCV